MEAVGILEAILPQLSPEHCRKLEQIALKVCLKKGKQLFAPGNPSRGFYVVSEGAIRVYGVSPQGKEITQEIADPGKRLRLSKSFCRKISLLCGGVER